MSGSTIILFAYAIYAILAMILFRLTSPRRAALIGYFGGWLILPVAIYRSGTLTPEGFTLDVIGTALPSDLLLTKAIVIPLTVLVGLALKSPSLLRNYRVGPTDIAMAAFCMTPLLAFCGGRIGLGSAASQVGYLAAVWGGTWMIGRLLFTGKDGRQSLIMAMAMSGLVLVPFAIVEGLGSPRLYALVYGAHPFHMDGVQRYYGSRPLAFFEHGNQYGIWIAMSALAAIHLSRQPESSSRTMTLFAGAFTICAFASQSIGAILLLIVGAAWLLLSGRARRLILIAGAVLTLIGGVAYLSGKGPMERLAYRTGAGEAVIGILKTAGRGSLSWRVHRDLEALETIGRAPLTGSGGWDWWRPLNAHPWGFPLLLAGQFGLLSLALVGFAMLAGSVRQLWHHSNDLLPVVVLLASIDAWLNSFLYFPAVLAAAAIGGSFSFGKKTKSMNNPEQSFG